MLALAQVVCLLVMTALFGASTYTAWIGISPGRSFLDFIGQAGSILPILGILTIFSSIIAFILGWKPNLAFANWLRAKIIVPAFLKIRCLATLTSFMLLVLSAEATFVLSFHEKPHAEIIDTIMRGNFDSADRMIAGNNLLSSRIADLHLLNDSERQLHFKSTGDPDENLCRIYYRYFDQRRFTFQPVWWRFSFRVAKGACLQVLDNQKQALVEYKKALSLARWIGPAQLRTVSRRLARLYIRDNKGYSGLPNIKERMKRVVALLATDPDVTAIRMRGTASYLLGEYSRAAKEWEQVLPSIDTKNYIERKKLLNNLGLTYLKLNQYTLALRRINTGLKLPYTVKNERERREQIRLLATKFEVLMGQRQCRPALKIFTNREKLKRQDRSPCTALLEAKIRACIIDTSSPTELEKNLFLNALLFGVQQNPGSFIDKSKKALTVLVEQGAIKFKGCYIGLEFDRNTMRRAIIKLTR